MIKNLILFDLEGVVYDSKTKGLCGGFQEIYTFTQINNITIAIATGATKEELKIIAKNIPLKKLFGKNIFSAPLWGFQDKSNPNFFKKILTTLDAKISNTRLIDDGETGISGAQKAGISTYYVSDNNEANNETNNKPSGPIANFLLYYTNQKGMTSLE